LRVNSFAWWQDRPIISSQHHGDDAWGVVATEGPSEIAPRFAINLANAKKRAGISVIKIGEDAMFCLLHPKSTLFLISIFAMVLLTCAVGVAQNCPLCSQPMLVQPFRFAESRIDVAPPVMPLSNEEGQTWVMRKRVNEVTVLFSVTNKGKFVDDLGIGEIEVRDDKKPPSAILDFRSEMDLPLRLGLVIDTSDSVTERFDFEKKAATKFLRQVIRGKMDQAFVMGFNSRTDVTQDFTDDPVLLEKGVARLREGGSTAVYDAVINACEKLTRTSESGTVARVIVLLTDGDDTASHRTYATAMEIAQRMGVTIFGVSTNDSDRSLVADVKLKGLAEATGGRTIFPGDPNDLPKAFSKVEKEIRSRYAVSYRPASFEPNGRYRKIKIEARRQGKKLHVHARRGYYARLETALR
jgi:Ca-activated chloride channel family protein